jgi:hypothetical protein
MYVVYLILPERQQAQVWSLIQTKIDSEAKMEIYEIQQLKNKKLKMTYGEILERNLNSTAWIYKFTETPYEKMVIFYGTGATLDLRDLPNGKNIFCSNASIKVVFSTDIEDKTTITLFLNNEEVEKDLKQIILEQLANGT